MLKTANPTRPKAVEDLLRARQGAAVAGEHAAAGDQDR